PTHYEINPLSLHDALPILTWKCRISFVKTVPAKTPLSYGQSFITRKPTRIATVTAGYGDGYLRAGSNRAKVLINGTLYRVLGRIDRKSTRLNSSHLVISYA